jgi:predicted PurR-regulated permease PerM
MFWRDFATIKPYSDCHTKVACMTPPALTSSEWSLRTKITVSLIALLLAGLLLVQLANALPMVIVALILAFLLYPLTNFFNLTLKIPRPLAVFFTFVFAAAVIIGILVLVVPSLTRQFAEFARTIPQLLERVEAGLVETLSQPLTFNNQPILLDGKPIIPLQQLQTSLGTDNILQPENLDINGIAGTVANSVGGLTRPAFSFLGTAFNAFINTIFFLTMLFYLLKDGGKFASNLVELAAPEYQGDTKLLLYELGEVWNAYLRGQFILCLFVGITVTIAGWLLGVPNAPILGLISGVLEFIPTIGPFTALVPAVLLALASQSSTLPFLSGIPFALVVLIVWTSIQQVQAILITPRVMGDSLDLHPFAILIAVLAGASIGGALGVILAAPFMATLRMIAQYIYGKLMDREPFPSRPADRGPTAWFAWVPPLIERIKTLMKRPVPPTPKR